MSKKSSAKKPRATRLPDDIKQRREKIAKKAGVDESQVQQVQLDIITMRKLGVLVDLDIHGLSMLMAPTSWDELGIPEGDVRRKRLHRGRKDLFQDYTKKFNSLASRFRQSLDKHSKVLEGFKPYSLVLYTAYDSWKADWDKLQGEWEEAKADFIEHYDELSVAYTADLGQMALEAWDALMARHTATTGQEASAARSAPSAAIVNGRVLGTAQEFAEYVLSNCNRLPSKERLEQGLYVTYRTAMLLSGADVEAEALRQDKLHTQRSQEHAKQQEASTKAQRERDETWKQERMAEIAVEETKQLSKTRLAAEEKKLKAMHEAELAHAREQLGQTISPFKDLIDQVRAQINADVVTVIASIKKNGHVRGKVAERIEGLRGIFELFNLPEYPDAKLDAALKELQARLKQHPAEEGKKYDTQAVLEQLDEIAGLTHEAAMDVAHRIAATTRAGALEL